MMCEDIVQNVFVKFFQNMEQIRNTERVDVWLFTTARNEIFSVYRAKHTHVDQYGVQDADEIDLDDDIKLDEQIELKEMNEMILKELDKISQDQREVFLLKEYGGFSYKEIANMIGIDEELVKSRLFKVRKKLVVRLSKLVT